MISMIKAIRFFPSSVMGHVLRCISSGTNVTPLCCSKPHSNPLYASAPCPAVHSYVLSGQVLNNNPNHTKIAPFHVPANSSVDSTHSKIPKTLWSRTVVEEIGKGDSKLYRNTWSSL